MLSKVTIGHMYKRFLSSVSYAPPSMVDLPSRWPTMDHQLREEIIEYLTWKMEDSWRNLSNTELKACYYISYGPWGPRGKSTEQLTPMLLIWKGLFSTTLFAALGLSLFNLKRDKQTEEALRKLEQNIA
ncbi:MTC3 (YGL226W) [Zygosaccharomyces parabailii]|uniref:ZYBA0S05-01134g1_1 n=1 Tax=Zygosaccharomyces bailii (strain CLIB 213 / ATCC 58445 / CBS 680 / BCRC 21525 / NBRC 1098 / NCYC 1416 / NRRL Y-2227) TaxID=1333698 RepID=A0A8J2X0C0_ZYGB2|nr:MTC3 (YGL226W) [Zygosaccharomyces parabailii]CDF89762.1 ZYBA0S05-01134g1_1 [Zygosaccharomyces bailii CLIB 213]CDH17521.1 related to Maintenance of telomere capping protein 3, mitochondrial [Zygosaccharomyces bailii ISA1307]SJM87026.1 related to Maintenance of telomere capping protein 3, mitochondrial [Zygosaccharomyces bailii]